MLLKENITDNNDKLALKLNISDLLSSINALTNNSINLLKI